MLQVLAANKEVEEANERRKKESEGLGGSLSSDAYSKQASRSSAQKGKLRGISYSPSDNSPSESASSPSNLDTTPSTALFQLADADESPSAPAFNFEEPPTAPQPPKVPKPNAPSNPSSKPNAFSTVPMPSAVAPAQPGQQIEGKNEGSDNPFAGLFDAEKATTKLQAVPEASAQKAKVEILFETFHKVMDSVFNL